MSEKPTDIYQLVASSKAPLPSEPAPAENQSTSATSLKESTSTNSLPPKKEDSTSEAEGTEEGSTVYVPPPRPAFRSDANDDILQKCLGMTDLIFAIYAVEVWHYDEETGKIFNVNLSSDDEESGGGGVLGGGGYGQLHFGNGGGDGVTLGEGEQDGSVQHEERDQLHQLFLRRLR